jgi:hypothetical protein
MNVNEIRGFLRILGKLGILTPRERFGLWTKIWTDRVYSSGAHHDK